MRISDSSSDTYLQHFTRTGPVTDVSPEERRQLLAGGRRATVKDELSDVKSRLAGTSTSTRSWLA